jgi:hypothetical protein
MGTATQLSKPTSLSLSLCERGVGKGGERLHGEVGNREGELSAR